MAGERRAEIVEAFGRQARMFARSALHRDEERLRRLVDRVAPEPGERGLDVACGPGIVATALAARGVRMVGADLTMEMLRLAADASDGRGAAGDGPGIDRVRAEAGRLPFADSAFDFVVCRNAFHHFLDPAAVVREMARVTRSTGRVVIEDLVAPEDLIERDEHEVIERLRDRAHVRTLTPDDFRRLLEHAGLAPREVQEFEMRIDFDEWMDRAFPEPAAKERARRLMLDGLAAPRGGRRVFLEEGRLRFVRLSRMIVAARP
jgi:ubiquinone/menaquinone biosynthesis C-methylase UbiE